MKKVFKAVWEWLKSVLKWCGCFFNLLEPDVEYPVLSISKITMWSSLGLSFYVAINNPSGSEIAASLGTNLIAGANYAYRRHLQVKTKGGAYKNTDTTAEEESK